MLTADATMSAAVAVSSPPVYEILYPGSYSMVKVLLQQGQSVKAESGAMVAMSAGIVVEGKLEGGVLGALGRKLLTGESAFLQTLRRSCQ